MTPLAKVLARWLPSALRVPAMAILYFGMAAGILLATRHDVARVIYIDVRAGPHAE